MEADTSSFWRLLHLFLDRERCEIRNNDSSSLALNPHDLIQKSNAICFTFILSYFVALSCVWSKLFVTSIVASFNPLYFILNLSMELLKNEDCKDQVDNEVIQIKRNSYLGNRCTPCVELALRVLSLISEEYRSGLIHQLATEIDFNRCETPSRLLNSLFDLLKPTHGNWLPRKTETRSISETDRFETDWNLGPRKTECFSIKPCRARLF